MKTEFIDLSPTQKQIVFEVPSESVEAEIDRTAQGYARRVRLPGFRPGKAPVGLIRQRFRDEIVHDVMHDLIPRLVNQVLEERVVEPVETPDVSDVHYHDGEPLRFTARFETVPPVEPFDYASLSLRRSPIAVSDEAVTSTIERLRQRNARFEPVEGRASQRGDVLLADLTRRVVARPAAEGESPGAGAGEPERMNGVRIEIGAPVNPPGFDDEVSGLEVGGRKSFRVAFPADYPVADLAGAEVEYDVEVKGLNLKVVPDVDDEFAKDLGEFGSLEELRERVRQDLQRDAERGQEREIREDLLRQLAARVTFDVPEALVAREVDRRTEDFARRLIDQRIDPLKAGIDWDGFRSGQRDVAADAVRSVLVLDDVARREGLNPGEEDIAKEVDRLAGLSGRSAAAVRAQLEKDGGLARVVSALRRDRTVEFLLSRATILSI